MIKSRRKLLTEYIGECWHEPITLETCSCNRERIVNAVAHAHNMNRPFTTPDDMNAVKEKMEEKGDIEDFFEYLYRNTQNVDCCDDGEKKMYPHSIFWLFTPSRFCDLAGEWLEWKESE